MHAIYSRENKSSHSYLCLCCFGKVVNYVQMKFLENYKKKKVCSIYVYSAVGQVLIQLPGISLSIFPRLPVCTKDR